jgi:hypothetical protein
LARLGMGWLHLAWFGFVLFCLVWLGLVWWATSTIRTTSVPDPPDCRFFGFADPEIFCSDSDPDSDLDPVSDPGLIAML